MKTSQKQDFLKGAEFEFDVRVLHTSTKTKDTMEAEFKLDIVEYFIRIARMNLTHHHPQNASKYEAKNDHAMELLAYIVSMPTFRFVSKG